MPTDLALYKIVNICIAVLIPGVESLMLSI